MKRLTIIAASAALAFLLTACGEQEKSEQKVKTTETTTQQPAQQPAQPQQ